MFYIFTKQFENFLNFKKCLFLKHSREFSQFLYDFNINFQNFKKNSLLSKFLLNVTASNRNSCYFTGKFVNNLLKLIQQYLSNIIILKFKYFENILKFHGKN